MMVVHTERQTDRQKSVCHTSVELAQARSNKNTFVYLSVCESVCHGRSTEAILPQIKK